jgi:hypothetical protein
MAVLVFIAGHAADRYTRQHVVLSCQFVEGLTGGFLAWGTFSGWLSVHEIFIAVALLIWMRLFPALRDVEKLE